MNLLSQLGQTTARFCTATLLATSLAASLAAQTPPTLTAITEIQRHGIVLGVRVQGPPNSMVLVAASLHGPLATPLHTPLGNLLIGSVDALLPLRTDGHGHAEMKVALPRPVRPFFFWMQALAGGKLTNAVAVGAGGGVRAAAVDIAMNSKGELTTMTIRAEGKPKDEVCIVFRDKNGKVLPPKICGTIGANGQLPGGSMTVPIPAAAKTFEVTVGGEAKAGGVLR